MKATHRNTLESIPWLVTGRLSDGERHTLEKHLSDCEECRNEFALQQRVHTAMTNESPRVDYAPGASLQKLWTRIGYAEQIVTPPRESIPFQSRISRIPKPRFIQWLAAAVVIEAIGITLLAMRTPQQPVVSAPLPPYRTVTTTEIVPQTAVLRVVFTADFSMGDLTSLLHAQRLTVVSGPTPAGVYTLATTAAAQELASTLPTTLAVLRAHAGVRLAEPIGPASAIATGMSAEKQPERRP